MDGPLKNRTPPPQLQFNLRSLLIAFMCLSLSMAMYRAIWLNFSIGPRIPMTESELLTCVFVMVLSFGAGLGILEGRPIRGMCVSLLGVLLWLLLSCAGILPRVFR